MSKMKKVRQNMSAKVQHFMISQICIFVCILYTRLCVLCIIHMYIFVHHMYADMLRMHTNVHHIHIVAFLDALASHDFKLSVTE